VKAYRVFSSLALVVSLLFGAGAPASADNELSAVASTFYIVAPGSDNSIPPIVHALTDQLQALFNHAGGTTVWVVPRLSWGPEDLANQCANDPGKDDPKGPKVLGGIILEGTNTYNSTDPYVLWTHGWAKVTTNAELVSCAPTGFPKPTITWVSNDVNGYGSRNGFPFENIAAGVLVFTTHNTEAKYLALGTAIGGESGASTVPPVNDAATTRAAASRVANSLLDKLNAGCAAADKNIGPVCALLGLPQAKLAPPPPE
jgi:hypothetical protein